MYYRILGVGTIQLSENYIEGYRAVVIDPKPSYDRATHHIESGYAIVDNEAHQVWTIVEGESELTDSEALNILMGN